MVYIQYFRSIVQSRPLSISKTLHHSPRTLCKVNSHFSLLLPQHLVSNIFLSVFMAIFRYRTLRNEQLFKYI